MKKPMNRMKSTRPRRERDFYETPFELADAAMMKLRKDGEFDPDSLPNGLDAGCGAGIWGKAVNNLFFFLDGIDIEPKVDENRSYYSQIFTGDYLKFRPDGYGYDLVFGNPPYSLAEQFVRQSFKFLTTNGRVYFLLRLCFLEGQDRGANFWPQFPLKRLYVCKRRPSFFSTHGNSKTTDAIAYAMFLWQKGHTGKPEIDWLDWDYKD